MGPTAITTAPATTQFNEAGQVSPAGRPRLPVRLMASLLYLKNSFNLSDEEAQPDGRSIHWPQRPAVLPPASIALRQP